jgi:hypothetical protein
MHYKNQQLLLFTEISAVYCKKYEKHKNTVFEKKNAFKSLKVMLFIVSTEVWRDNVDIQRNKNEF